MSSPPLAAIVHEWTPRAGSEKVFEVLASMAGRGSVRTVRRSTGSDGSQRSIREDDLPDSGFTRPPVAHPARCPWRGGLIVEAITTSSSPQSCVRGEQPVGGERRRELGVRPHHRLATSGRSSWTGAAARRCSSRFVPLSARRPRVRRSPDRNRREQPAVAARSKVGVGGMRSHPPVDTDFSPDRAAISSPTCQSSSCSFGR